MENYINNITF